MPSVRPFLIRQLRRLRRFAFPALRRADIVQAEHTARGVDLLYRFVLARPPDEEGREYYLRLIREDGLTLREVAAEIAASDEFQARLHAALAPEDTFVDAQELNTTLTVEELAGTAEEYYRTTLEFSDGYLAKPFADPQDAPDLLGSFAQVVAGLRLAPGLTVLDFGAGACWTTRCLTQFGCAAIALDVSASALELGRQLYARLPPIGDRPSPQFLVFDGRRIDLPDASVDRIFCFDAFHHVPNPAEVMQELGRVLRPGGVAGFSEPGRHHSKGSRSQYEMKNYTALERDVVMDDIWRWARAAGFQNLELAIFNTEPYRVPLDDFEDVLRGGRTLNKYGDRVRVFLRGHQTFFLTKGGGGPKDSRERSGLKGEITVRLRSASVRETEMIEGEATVQNVGSVVWLSGDTPFGGVNLGVHLRTRDGLPLSVDFARVRLLGGTMPGEMQRVSFALKPPDAGEYLLEFDLVSERVGWFEMNGSTTVTVALTVT
jgi:SAM-dependent methyltransferase